MDLKFNAEQLKAIHSTSNTIVMAGAGSGKTSVLARRYCWLVKEKKVKVEQILTLTFTNKAAADMYEKIYKNMQKENDPFVHKQLENFSHAQISTIDSFCHQVVANSCELFGLNPDFHYDDKQMAQLAQEVSLDFLLANYQKTGLKEFIKINGFEATWYSCLQPIALNYLNLAQEYNFVAMLRNQLQKIKVDLNEHFSLFTDYCHDLLNIDADGKKSIIANQQVITNFQDLSTLFIQQDFTAASNLLTGCKLTKPGGKASDTIKHMKSLVDKIREQKRVLIDICHTITHKDIIESLCLLLNDFQKKFNSSKRKLGIVTFHDVAEMAVAALKQNKPLRNFYKQKYRFIMIDEFQDNNNLQKDLLYLLAEKSENCTDSVPEYNEIDDNKLFFVGDEKQSIYKFRGADVSVFKKLNTEILNGGGQAIVLKHNYRSNTYLIDFFNDIFSRIMHGARESYEACFQELKPGLEQTTGNKEIFFFYKPFMPDEAAIEFSNDEAEAFFIVKNIHRWVEKKELIIKENNLQRAATYNDFAILMRSTGNQIIFESTLRRFNIPYTTQEMRSAFLDAPINDIYLLLQLAVNPADRLIYASLLRSPLVNVSDHTLLTILMQEKEPFAPVKLKSQDQKAYTMGAELFNTIQQDIDQISITELLFKIWYEVGYRYHILKHPKFHNMLEYYDFLFALADRVDKRNEPLIVFLDSIRQRLGRYEKQEELEILKQSEQGVNIMSIHRAKGLEFPVVILANTGNRGKTKKNQRPYYISEDYGLSFHIGRHNYFYGLAQSENQAREIAELKRLLYVGLTRAKSYLVISGVHHKNNLNTDKAHINMIFKGLGVDPDQMEALTDNGNYKINLKIIKPLTREEYFKNIRQKKPPALPTLKQLYNTLPVIEYKFIKRDYSVTELNKIFWEREYERGIEHRKIELPSLPIDEYLKQQRLAELFGSLTHYVINQSILNSFNAQSIPIRFRKKTEAGVFDKLLENARQLADVFFNSEYGRMLPKADNLKTEFPFLHRFIVGNKYYYIHGQIDLYFETENTAYIIDFKTEKSTYEYEHMAQLDLYQRACRGLTKKHIIPLIFFLRTGRTFELKHTVDWQDIFQNLP